MAAPNRHATIVGRRRALFGPMALAAAACASCSAVLGIGDLTGPTPTAADAAAEGGPLADASPRSGEAGDDAADGGYVPSTCAPGYPAWIEWGDADVRKHPHGAVFVGSEDIGDDAGHYELYVCRTSSDAGQFPGKFVEGIGCFFSADSDAEVMAGAFQILVDSTDQPCLGWTPSDPEGVPPGAVPAGEADSDLLYVCRGDITEGTSGTHSGYMRDIANAKCHVPFHQSARDLSTYQVLTR